MSSLPLNAASNTWLATAYDYFPLDSLVPRSLSSVPQYLASLTPLALNLMQRSHRFPATQPFRWTTSLGISVGSNVVAAFFRKIQYEWVKAKGSIWNFLTPTATFDVIPSPKGGTRTDFQTVAQQTWALSAQTVEATTKAVQSFYSLSVDQLHVTRYNLLANQPYTSSSSVQTFLGVYAQVKDNMVRIEGFEDKIAKMAPLIKAWEEHLKSLDLLRQGLETVKGGNHVQFFDREGPPAAVYRVATALTAAFPTSANARIKEFKEFVRNYFENQFSNNQLLPDSMKTLLSRFVPGYSAAAGIISQDTFGALPDEFYEVFLKEYENLNFKPLNELFESLRAELDVLRKANEVSIASLELQRVDLGLENFDESILDRLIRLNPKLREQSKETRAYLAERLTLLSKKSPSTLSVIKQRLLYGAGKVADLFLLAWGISNFLTTQKEHEEKIAALRRILSR